MQPWSKEERQMIVRNELYVLKEDHYISEETFENVIGAHQRFYEDLKRKPRRVANQARQKPRPSSRKPIEDKTETRQGPLQDSTAVPQHPSNQEQIRPQSGRTSEGATESLGTTGTRLIQGRSRQERTQQGPVRHDQENSRNYYGDTRETPIYKKKKAISSEQSRERNITWLLNLGVILLLLGGLFVATSNWDRMVDLTKAGLIAAIAILFFGSGFLAEKVFNIKKTAFAFTVLGSLFLPIFLLSVGWFELLGDYFSVFGEGRYLFGMASSFVVLPVYVILAKKLSARLFVWFSFLSLTIGTGFMLAAFEFGRDGFYLGMILFNSLLIAGFHLLKRKEAFKLFTKELVIFSQINLILTSLLMLFFFQSHVYYGFNLLLSAVVYMAMVYVSGKKEYHFVFTGMFVYGVYQLVEHSLLDVYSPVFYAVIGLVFLAIPRILDERFPWQKIFQWTSAVVSGLAFMYISFEGIFLKAGGPSFILLLSYMLIASNFLYLSNVARRLVFIILSSVFMSVTLMEGVVLLDKVVKFQSFLLPLFFIGFVMFLVFGLFLKVGSFKVTMASSRIVGWGYMALGALGAFIFMQHLELGIMLLFMTLAAYLTIKKETLAGLLEAAMWATPIFFGLAFVAFAEEISLYSEFYRSELGFAVSFIIGSMVLLAARLLLKEKVLKNNSFYVSGVFYSIGMLFALALPINGEWVRPLIFLGGTFMYYWLYTYTKKNGFAFVISALSLVTYFTVLSSVHGLAETVPAFDYVEFTLGAVIVFVIALLVKRKDSFLSHAYVVTGHIYFPFVLVSALAFYGENALWSFLIALPIYMVSMKKSVQNWAIHLFLYSAFTSLFMVFVTWFMRLEDIDLSYAFLITSVIIVIYWAIGDPVVKRRTLYYLIPFSFLGMGSFLLPLAFTLTAYLALLLYAAGMLAILHREKWSILAFWPVMMIYLGTLEYLVYERLGAGIELFILAGFGIVLLALGHWIYKDFFTNSPEWLNRTIDVYGIAGFLFLATMYAFPQPELWMKVLPGVLMAVAIWLQRKRVSAASRWIPLFVAGGYLLQPYYALMREMEIPSLLEKEVLLLPLLVLVIYLRVIVKGRYEKATSGILWAVLSIVSIILVLDGLETSTVYDALILGTLSLASILAGLFLRIKSYFFVGSAVLLLNVLIQTKPLWGNLPWWAYLLIAGSILIVVASMNEWQKQKVAQGERNILKDQLQKIIEKLKNGTEKRK